MEIREMVERSQNEIFHMFQGESVEGDSEELPGGETSTQWRQGREEAQVEAQLEEDKENRGWRDRGQAQNR